MVATSDAESALRVRVSPNLSETSASSKSGVRGYCASREGALELLRVGVRRVRRVGRVVEELPAVGEVEAVGTVDQLDGPVAEPRVEVVLAEVGVDLRRR